MDTQYKILFLIKLLEDAVELCNSSQKGYTLKHSIKGNSLSIEISYKKNLILAEHLSHNDLSEVYVSLQKIVKKLIAGEILYKNNSTMKDGEIKVIKAKW